MNRTLRSTFIAVATIAVVLSASAGAELGRTAPILWQMPDRVAAGEEVLVQVVVTVDGVAAIRERLTVVAPEGEGAL